MTVSKKAPVGAVEPHAPKKTDLSDPSTFGNCRMFLVDFYLALISHIQLAHKAEHLKMQGKIRVFLLIQNA